MSKHKIQIDFNEAQMQMLRKERKRLGSSMNSIVRLAVIEYFLKQGVGE